MALKVVATVASAIEYIYLTTDPCQTVAYHGWGNKEPVRVAPITIMVSNTMPPENIEAISEINLNYNGQWVRVHPMHHPGVVWELLACGMPKPDDMEYSIAALLAQAIWLDTILHSDHVKGHPVALANCFHDAIGHAVEGDTDFETSFSGVALRLSDFYEIALDAGVDFRLRAWLDGVPLEHVLAE